MIKEGTVFQFDYEHDGVLEKNHLYRLEKSDDFDFLFLIKCIEGYHKGAIEGYIGFEKKGEKFISKDHLVKELNRNFLNIIWDTFVCFE